MAAFTSDAPVSNPEAHGLPSKDKRDAVVSKEQKEIHGRLKDRMDLQRAVLRGTGFYEWMTNAPEFPFWPSEPAGFRSIPFCNLLQIEDKAYAEAIVREAPPQDQERFRGYLVNRPLALGIIAAVSTHGPRSHLF